MRINRAIYYRYVAIMFAAVVMLVLGLFLIIDDWFIHALIWTGYGGDSGPWFLSHDIYGIVLFMLGSLLLTTTYVIRSKQSYRYK